MSAKRIWTFACLLLIAALFVPAQAAGDVPNAIDSGVWHGGHCQGIAVDRENGFIYYSFTTELVKTDLQGKSDRQRDRSARTSRLHRFLRSRRQALWFA